MIRPRRIKLAATSGVGATTSVTTLYIHEQKDKKAIIEVYPLYDKRREYERILARPQSRAPASKLKETTEDCTGY